MIRFLPAGYFITAISVVAVTAAFSRTQSNPDKGPEETIRHLEAAYGDAVKRQDIAALQTMLAEDFLATSTRGELRN